MQAELRQSTAATVVLGPFVDDVDFKTAETALTLSQADIRLSKNGGAYAQSNNAAGATHLEGGDYAVPLDATDTATLGRLRVRIAEAGALVVWDNFMVITQQAWDSRYGADVLQVDVAQWLGVAPNAAVAGRIEAEVPAAGFTQAAADKVWASAARTLTSFGTLIADIWATVIEGALTATGVLRILLASGANKTNGAGTATFNVRDVADTKNRIVAGTDVSGNRTSVTLDAT
jgi:hypothetical protein